jgi:formylmethanofuran dehydrogenase subunit A
MRTIRTKLYKLSELSKDAQQKAIENLSDINVDYDWWQSVYQDAENVGLKIIGFDIDRGSYCKGDFIESAEDTAKRILQEHGNECETFKTASNFLSECEVIVKKAEIEGKDGDEDYWYSDELEELEEEFKKSLLEDYRIMLQKEYEYQTSEEAIKETIEANEYEFTKEGKLF